MTDESKHQFTNWTKPRFGWSDFVELYPILVMLVLTLVAIGWIFGLVGLHVMVFWIAIGVATRS